MITTEKCDLKRYKLIKKKILIKIIKKIKLLKIIITLLKLFN